MGGSAYLFRGLKQGGGYEVSGLGCVWHEGSRFGVCRVYDQVEASKSGVEASTSGVLGRSSP